MTGPGHEDDIILRERRVGRQQPQEDEVEVVHLLKNVTQ